MVPVDEFASIIAAVVAASAGFPLVEFLRRGVNRRLDQEVASERTRLERSVLGGVPTGSDEETADTSTTESDESDQFTRLLIEYYAHGLAQAKRSFVASLVSSVLGGMVLLAGVTLAIFKADTTGGQYASIVVSLAGVLTNATGVLFHRQSNRALQHMEGQTALLRQDMRADREARDALTLLDDVEDGTLRDRLRAGLILRLASAELPNFEPSVQPTEPGSEQPFLSSNGGSVSTTDGLHS